MVSLRRLLFCQSTLNRTQLFQISFAMPKIPSHEADQLKYNTLTHTMNENLHTKIVKTNGNLMTQFGITCAFEYTKKRIDRIETKHKNTKQYTADFCPTTEN